MLSCILSSRIDTSLESSNTQASSCFCKHGTLEALAYPHQWPQPQCHSSGNNDVSTGVQEPRCEHGTQSQRQDLEPGHKKQEGSFEAGTAFIVGVTAVRAADSLIALMA